MKRRIFGLRLAAVPAALGAIRALPAPALALLGGCGVGGEGTGGIATTRGAVAGRLEALGLPGGLRVAGQLLDDREAQLVVEWDPRAPSPRALAELRLGMVALVEADASRVLRIEVAPEVLGPVQQVQPALGRLQVAGQTVQLDARPSDPTLRAGFAGTAELRAGQRVEVHGQRDAQGLVRASRIVLLGPDAEPGVRVAGPVGSVDAGASRLRIGALEVVATGPLPAPGTRVVVFAPALDAEGRLRAAVLRAEPALPQAAARARIAGTASRWRAPQRFELRGYEVDVSGLSLSDAQRAALAAGGAVVAAGRVDRGVLLADELALADESLPLEGELGGSVAERVGASGFALRGTPVDATAARFTALTSANLANGVPVLVRGRLGAAGLAAREVAAQAPPDAVFVQAGTVRLLDRGARTIAIEGLAAQFAWSAATLFENGTAAELAEGRVIEVRGRQAGAVFTIDRLRFAAAQAPIELSGIAGNVEAAGDGGEFEIGPVDMVWTPATRFIGPTNTAADLVGGRVIRVSGVVEGPVVRALTVDTRATQPGVVRLRGTVERFVSLASFRLDGQAVDAGAASFDPPALRAALAGAYVDVEGVLNAGVLVASRVSDP